jgi:hypothetical protein
MTEVGTEARGAGRDDVGERYWHAPMLFSNIYVNFRLIRGWVALAWLVVPVGLNQEHGACGAVNLRMRLPLVVFLVAVCEGSTPISEG